MRTLRDTDLEAVTRTLAAGRDLRTGSAPWTLRFLAHADEQFATQWTEIELSGTEALDIVLPAHAGEPCRGDRLTLLPPGGGTVRDAALALSRIQPAYAESNASCWSRISQAAVEPFSPVIVTAAPLTLPDYAGLATGAGTLFHLDGFHRLVGWALAGRLTADCRVSACAAGPR